MKSQKPVQELLDFSIVNVDKPAGLTSYQVVEKIRKIFSAKKAGHFGTLDTNVTGVLPVALNRACKLSKYFMGFEKEYIGKMRLHSEISKEVLRNEIKNFLGKIIQKPPIRSAVKRVEREREVIKFEIIEINDRVVEFHCEVEAGTYIRKLVHDIGEKIGGAQMIELQRTRAGIFREKESHGISEIEEVYEKFENGDETKLREILIPGEIICEIIPVLEVKEESIKSLLNGKPLMKEDLISESSDYPESVLTSVFSKEKFIGIYKKEKEKNILAKPEFVLN